MPGPAFFQQLGLFALPDFLNPQDRASLCRDISAAPLEKAIIVGSHGEEHLDLNLRKVDSCNLPKEIALAVEQRVLQIQPEIEKHFKVRLASCEPPQYLIYNSGDFFKPHQDVGGYGLNHPIHRRRVSVVIFLNRESQEPAEDAYGGGQLTFYGLLDGPQWEKCPFALNAEPGLLIAFPSDKLHEVKPVSHGKRFTVVTWFHGLESSATEQEAVKSATPAAAPQ